MNTLRAIGLCGALLGASACVPPAAAQMPATWDGLDPSWNGTGTLAVAVPGHVLSDYVAAMAIQPDGRILLAGACMDSAQNYTTTCIARLLPNGVRDFSFGPSQTGTLALSDFAPYAPTQADYAVHGQHGLLRQADGKIVVVGSTTNRVIVRERTTGAAPSVTRAMVVRLLADGTLDPSVAQPVTFEFAHDDAEPLSEILAVAQQADGKLVVAGRTHRARTLSTDPQNVDFAVARLRSDLSLDPSFNGTGKIVVAFDLGGDHADGAGAVAIQSDGRILVAGNATVAGEDTFNTALLRLTASGTRDASFGNNGVAWFDFGATDNGAMSLRLDAAGRIWTAGYRSTAASIDFLVARVRANGSALDSGFCGSGYADVPFDGGGAAPISTAADVLLQSDGRIVLPGYTYAAQGLHFAAVRLLPNCLLDSTFASGGRLHAAFAPTLTYSIATAAAFGGHGIVLAGIGWKNNGDSAFGVAQLRIDNLFRNGFDAP